MKLSDMLIGAKEVIRHPEDWTQGWFAKDERGNHATEFDTRATCFCSLGALNRVGLGVKHRETYHKARNVLDTCMEGHTSTYNDTHSHEEVMAKWDEAIKTALEQESKLHWTE